MEQRISLDDLPRHTDWVGRVCQTKPFAQKTRDRDQILSEYQVSKWGKVKAFLEGGGTPTLSGLLRAQGIDPEKKIPFSRNGELFVAASEIVFEEWNHVILQTLKNVVSGAFGGRVSGALVELGSGLGDKLVLTAGALRPNEAWGGEFTESGVEVGTLLARASGMSSVHFRHFDYHTPQTCDWIPENALIYSVHSIEQIPQLSLETLRAIAKRKPRAVVHLEPVFVEEPHSTLETLQKGYTQLNDYNRNLEPALRQLEREGVLRLSEVRRDVFACLPLNPTSILQWSPC